MIRHLTDSDPLAGGRPRKGKRVSLLSRAAGSSLPGVWRGAIAEAPRDVADDTPETPVPAGLLVASIRGPQETVTVLRCDAAPARQSDTENEAPCRLATGGTYRCAGDRDHAPR